jgi:hypothetical protein
VTGPVAVHHQADPARAGPRAIEAGGDAARSGNATDQTLRERKL